MLFKLSLSNIRKSFRDYAIYFFTLIIGVAVFYVFNAIGEQTAFLKVSQNTSDIIDLLKNMLNGISAFVSVVLGLLIVYASRFLMKRRNKEFALYLILGMGKGKISAILLIETIIIGLGSLGVGLLIGIGLSQLMSTLVANLFEADMTDYTFMVSSDAIIKTAIYFGIMYIVVMIFNSFMISKCKLINLLQSGKKSEKLKLKNPVLCVIIFIISACALGYAYYTAGWKTNNMSTEKLVKLIATGAVSTFLIFWSVSGMMLRVVMSMKKTYYKGLNSFTFRQISSKVNTTVASMTVICLMLFVTICTLSSAFSIRNSMNANLKEMCPADLEIQYTEYDTQEYRDHYVDIVAKAKEFGYDFEEDLSESVHFHCYGDDNFTFADALGSHLEEIQQKYVYMEYDNPEDIVRLSDYNAIRRMYGKDEITLNDNEFAIICDFKSIKAIRDEALTTDKAVTIFGHTLISKYDECQDGFIDISSQHVNIGFYVVPDSVVDENYATVDFLIGNYNAETKEDKQIIEDKINDKYKNFFKDYTSSVNDNQIGYMYSINTRIDIAESTVGLGAMVTFIGLYIGLIFLISCAAILALKQLSESVDSISRYEMLRKIGAEESDISKSLFRQTGIFFLLPLLLACVHSVFGMKFSAFILETFGTEKLAESIGFTSIMILLIYGGYFLITYFCSKSIIKSHKQ
ncbi:MAG: FtsX-like permease family protein [Muribaculaceae bacterium]|nr:FtsX-like permease family protein [Alistipes senegalensis]MCM1473690.1 FtsX-like permease family protein [Muribaculaceae bacterium]